MVLSIELTDTFLILGSFPIKKKKKGDTPFHLHPDLNSLCGHLRDISKEDIFELGVSAAGTGFLSWSRLELMYLSLIINQFKPNLAL